MNENKTEENNNNLISIGKEIMLSSPNHNTIPTPKEIKSSREEINLREIKPYHSINLFRNSNISTLNDTKKSLYSNLSKLNYKDGFILKDATNSNPGFGLWSIKLSQSMKNSKKLDEEKILLDKKYNIYNNKLNIEINEEINNSDSSNINILNSSENNFEEDRIEKIMINKLTKKNKKLEKKYQTLLINYYDRENYFLGLERVRKKYEKLINDGAKEKNEAEANLNNLNNNNQALIISILNARKEIDRIINSIKESQINIKKELEEYNNILKEEEEKRKRIINWIKTEEKQINMLQDKMEENEGKINNNDNENKNENLEKIRLERENKINKKKEYIKKLQKELERLYIIDKEKQNEKKELFNKINEKNNDKKNNIKNKKEIFKRIENQEREKKWNEQAILIRNNIILSLKRNSKSK